MASEYPDTNQSLVCVPVILETVVEYPRIRRRLICMVKTSEAHGRIPLGLDAKNMARRFIQIVE